ncbi:MAG: 3-hydroxyacyl-CoA dehydrogenase NAD-binding domain-containing protein [Planctomycetaceae bacterium]
MSNNPRTGDDASDSHAMIAAPLEHTLPVRSVGIIGAGAMGRGIAAANVRAGIRVILFDTNAAAAQRAVRDLIDAANPGFPRRPHFLRKAGSLLATVATAEAELASAELVIEAVPEDIEIKSALISRLDRQLSPQTIVASNTSSIPIAALASNWKIPGRFCGLHFCHPVEERLLVEVIAGQATSPETLKTVSHYAAALGKHAIIVRDGPGFLLNRVLSPYLTESLELLLEGASCESLNDAAREFGMPWGPLRQLDEFGLDVALAVGGTLLRAYPDRFVPSQLLIAMYKAGRLGRKSGGGFLAEGGGPEGHVLAPPVSEIIRARQRNIREFSRDEISRRLLLPMLLEATRALEESVVENSAVIDTALRDGLGMSAASPGLFGWANRIGAASLLDGLRPFRELGKRFEPTQTLLRAAADRSSL